MLFCHSLLKGLNIEPEFIQPCCVGAAKVPGYAFSGATLDMKSYKAFLYQVLHLLQTGSDLCRGCADLISIPDQDPARLALQARFNTIHINHHRSLCNCRCVYCPFWKRKTDGPPRPILPLLRNLARQQALESGCCVNWGGGEPTILAEFDAACREIAERGYPQYIHSNALRRSEAILDILSGRENRVNVSLDASDANTYQRVKGVKGWNKVLATLEAYLAASADPRQVEIKYILFSLNNTKKELERFFSVCRAIGVKNVQYSFNGEESSVGAVSETSLRGAVYFRNKAKELNMECSDFYVAPSLLKAMNALS